MDSSNTGEEDPNIADKCESNPIRKNKRSKTFGARDHFNEVDGEDSDCPRRSFLALSPDERKNSNEIKQITLDCDTALSRVCDTKLKAVLGKQSEDGEEEDGYCCCPYNYFSTKRCMDTVCRMIIMQKLPFQIVEDEGFQMFSFTLQPGFIMPSRKAVVRDCLQLYSDEKEKLKRTLVEKEGRVCLAMEIWTVIPHECYVALTVHFIDDDWKLQKSILNFSSFPDPEEVTIEGDIIDHEKNTIDYEEDTIEGDIIGQMIETCLVDWGIEKVFTVTVDNSSYNDRALAYLVEKIRSWNGVVLNGDFMHVKSCASTVNLMVRDVLKKLHGSIARIRNAIEYVKFSSPSLLEIFKKCARDENISCKNPLYLDVPTRWNTTYTMLERAVKFQKAFEKVEAEDKEFCHFVLFDQDTKTDHPRSEDWDNARAFLKPLKFFHDVTLRVTRSSSSCVKSHRYFHEICLIKEKIEEFSRSDNSLLADTARNMKVKYETLWESNEDTNFLLYVSVVLDPRYKLQFVSFTLQFLYEEVRSNEIVKKIEDMARHLYSEYRTSYVESETSCTSMGQEDVGEEDDKDYRYASMFTKQLIEEDAKKTELDKYLSEPCEIADETFDILDWWRVNSSKYKVLGKMAKDVLAISLSTTAIEPAFSTEDRVLDSYHRTLSPNLVEAVICLRNWLGSQDETDEREVEEMEDEDWEDEDAWTEGEE